MKKTILLLLFLVLTHSCKSENPDTKEDVKQTTPVETDGTPTPTPAPTPVPAPFPAPIPTPAPPPSVPSLTWTQKFMNLVNTHRKSIGVKTLIHDEDVAQIVIRHSQDMANGTVAFGHSGFSERCTDARQALGGGNWCGENVAAGQSTPEAAYTAWMNSPGHRANIEQSRATHTGFGYVKSSTGKYYWTQLFVEL